MKNCCIVSIVVVAVVGFVTNAYSATITAANCSVSAVAAAVAAASNGDTVVIPAGTCRWTTALAINKAITLQGQGIGNTVIQDGVTSYELMIWTLVANQTSRMTGIEFQNGGRTSQNPSGIIGFIGRNTDSRRVRVDHCKFDHLFGTALMFDTALGVVDHNTFLYTATSRAANVLGTSWNGASWGDGAWAAPTDWGTDKFTFFEDNTFTYDTAHSAHIDAFNGARYVARYNTVTRGWFDAHGTDTSGRNRGTRAIEVYNNSLSANGGGSQFVNLRSGTALIHNNTMTGYAAPTYINLINYREFANLSPWGGADGTNSWDKNVAGGPFNTRTATSGGTLTVTVTGAGWTTNQWRGYSIKKTSGGGGFSPITSNTTDTISFLTNHGFGPNLSFSNGDTFQIWRVDEALDQPGKGAGSLVSGNPPVIPPGWYDEVDDPVYEWNNTSDGVSVSVSTSISVRSGEHYFKDTQAPGYAPYRYPHPLTQVAQGTPPAAPTNVRIVR